MKVMVGFDPEDSGRLWLQVEVGHDDPAMVAPPAIRTIAPTASLGDFLTPNQIARLHEATGIWLEDNPGAADFLDPPRLRPVAPLDSTPTA